MRPSGSAPANLARTSARAVAYTSLGQSRKAIEDYDQAIRLNPRMAEAYSSRASAYNELGQPHRGLEDFDEAIRLNAEYVDAYVGRLLTHTLLSDEEAARADFEKALQLGVDGGALQRAVEQARRRRSHTLVR